MPKFESRAKRGHLFRLYAYGILCAILTGCASTGGNFDLGRADAQVQTLSEQHPELAEKLIALRENIKSAQNEISRQEGTIDKLTKLLDTSEQKATQRLIRIWQLTSALLSILLVVGVFIAWKLR